MIQILITGAAGFIGFHLSSRLLKEGYSIIGIDNLNPYYDVSLKRSRLDIISKFDKFKFFEVSIEDRDEVNAIFKNHSISCVINLAAQAGVRYSLTNPYAYIDSNIMGFINILEASRHNKVEHLIYASSSSVYGANTKMPFSVHDNVDHPVSLYAATKKSNELMAHSYSHLFGLPTTGLRFFTVYGPWGRPDMALFIFTKAILSNEPIKVFNNGQMKRDFTYIDDIVEAITRLLEIKPKRNLLWSSDRPDPGSSYAPYKLYNIGNNQPVELLDFIAVLENKLGLKAKIEFYPLQSGDVPSTYADVDDIIEDIGFKPNTGIKQGIGEFVNWYKNYYGEPNL